jgi:hypothetical protein
MPTAQEIYDKNIRCLPPYERLQIAALILNDIPPPAVVDYSEEWTEEDMDEFRHSSCDYINRRLEEEENA